MTAPHPSVNDLRCTVCGKPLDLATGTHHRKCPAIARHIKKLIAGYPRCSVCKQPMVAGQAGTHLSCQPGSTTKGAACG